MIEHANIDDLEITLDMLGCDSVTTVFLGELLDRRADLIDDLVRNGTQESRFKIQMIDEIFDIKEEILSELKSRKSEMN